MLDRGDEDKDDFRQRLAGASNSKLLRLYDTASQQKERFGSNEKLIDALLKLMRRSKDTDYREKLARMQPSQLLGMHQALTKKENRASAQ